MDYHGIEMGGSFIDQKVASLPTWTSDDIGRTLYLTTNNKRYYANNTGWIEPEVDKIWTYQDTAPTGWTIMSGVSDTLIATKGSASTYYITGETQAGTWTQSDHILTTDEMPSHTHTRLAATQPYDFHISRGGIFPLTNVYSRNTGSAGGDQAHNHGDTYRPLANVGIIILKSN